MEEFFSSNNVPDTPTPINSAGNPTQKYRNAAGDFDLKRDLRRKVKDRNDLDQPKSGVEPMSNGGKSPEDDATSRYFGSFSIEAKRNVFDLLKNHPEYNNGRVKNNTREVMKNDPTKTVENGGYMIYQNQPQASQSSYNEKQDS